NRVTLTAPTHKNQLDPHDAEQHHTNQSTSHKQILNFLASALETADRETEATIQIVSERNKREAFLKKRGGASSGGNGSGRSGRDSRGFVEIDGNSDGEKEGEVGGGEKSVTKLFGRLGK
ncbi:hypothetical protein HK098_000607, partial [Nowakowskiella sp. JEL0407]